MEKYKFSREVLIQYLKDFYLENNCSPKCYEKTLPSHWVYHSVFGSWRKALAEAGLQTNRKEKLPVEVKKCNQCSVEFKIFNSHLNSKHRKSNNTFCSKSCATTYNNTHKTKGTRVSKLEVWLQTQLSLLYPTLEIHYNRKDAINSELDIYIPSLKLAFELNGIYHYEPIHGEEVLSRIKNNDNRKFAACIENKISLCTIDTSSLNYFKSANAQKYLDIISSIIEKSKQCN